MHEQPSGARPPQNPMHDPVTGGKTTAFASATRERRTRRTLVLVMVAPSAERTIDRSIEEEKEELETCPLPSTHQTIASVRPDRRSRGQLAQQCRPAETTDNEPGSALSACFSSAPGVMAITP